MTKHIAEVINLENQRYARNEEKAIDQNTIAIVNELFRRFDGIYSSFRNTFRSTEHLNATKKQWMLGFMDEKIDSIEKLEYGLKKCRRLNSDFIPSLGQFIAYCQIPLEDMGVPPLDVAYDEACKNSHPASEKNWSHKLVQHAWKLTGSYLLSTATRSVTFPIFKRNYEISIRDWRAGKPIEDIQPAMAITENKEFRKNEDLAKKSISQCLGILKGTLKSNSNG